MVRQNIYRLIVIRPGGTRELISTGITEQMATAMWRILGEQKMAVRFLIEPERNAARPSTA